VHDLCGCSVQNKPHPTHPPLPCLVQVEAWLLLSGSGDRGANLNIFFEASLAWSRRQSEMRARRARLGWWDSSFEPAGGSSSVRKPPNRNSEQGASGGEGTGRDAWRNAAMVAASARRWRDYQRARRQHLQSTRLLSSGDEVAQENVA
jgi:hypothetical protein